MEKTTDGRAVGRSVLGQIEVKRVTETIIERLEDGILSGELEVGEKLPSEQELATQAGVGRRAIREALKALEMKGLISIRKGSGAFVIRNDFDNYIETLSRNIQAYLHVNRATLAHILQYREILGGSVISILAARQNEAAIERIAATLARQELALEKNSASLYTKAHIDYHLAIIDSLENPVVSMMYTQIIRLLQPYMRRSGSDPEIMRQSIMEHREILEAIKAGDTTRAYTAFHTHLESSLAHLRTLVSEQDEQDS
ncbi:MAG: FadR family transcriptional regulator [Spirochaetaceae bacterium]|nr:MAG: FadR family transcriptional regulator [Spirochaetaceae bacterium]